MIGKKGIIMKSQTRAYSKDFVQEHFEKEKALAAGGAIDRYSFVVLGEVLLLLGQFAFHLF